MEQVLLCTGEMLKRHGISRSTLPRRVKQGRIPKPVNPSGKPKGRRYYVKSEVEEYERRWRDERDGKQLP
jgi:predicted DNA-binding transcriptional regulator AlpA